MTSESAQRILGAVEQLKVGNRSEAAALLKAEVDRGAPDGNRWKSVQQLATQIGEIEIAIEAARRFAFTPPVRLGRLLEYWGTLAEFGRSQQALEEVRSLPDKISRHPDVLHFRGAIAGENGDFNAAEDFFRESLAIEGRRPQTWFALAMIKTFNTLDPDIASMQEILPGVERAGQSDAIGRLYYALAKAAHDCGEFDRAFKLYRRGAAVRGTQENFHFGRIQDFADGLKRDFTAKNLCKLQPSGAKSSRAIFVNGLPRSGTTLVEQILTSHSEVGDGAELNLVRPALIPTIDRSWRGALHYENRSPSSDPWGDIGREYERMLAMRFPEASGLIVDKTLGQSHFMGLILHIWPEAKVIWLRRNPEDAAISCFRSYFTSSLPWSWSLEDIGRFFRIEDKLYSHWLSEFPGRILAVPYEELVSEPEIWSRRMLSHVGLAMENRVLDFHATKRSVRTASVKQVRGPITTTRIGAAEAYAAHMGPFRRAYAADAI